MIRSLVVPALLVAGACYHGPSAGTFEPAQWPDGIWAELRLSQSRVYGELLEVQDTALLVLRPHQIVLVPIRAIRAAAFRQLDAVIYKGRISERDLTRLRLVSRFPAGLTPELRARLLAAYGQADVERVSALDDFAARARAGTERFRNAEAALAAGYRPVGPDFPGMGRHWIHPALILRDSLDPAQPPVLEYAEIGGRLTLVGVAYATLVKDASPPTSLPVPAGAWHFHQGTVEEESFLRSHAGLGHLMPGPRIAVLHAWIWLDNPDGLLATDNWALPYARLGFRTPPHSSHGAARALALAAGDGGGGRTYLEALLRAVGRPDVEEMSVLATVVTRHQTAARELGDNVAELERCWTKLWDDVQAAVRPEVWERLAAVR